MVSLLCRTQGSTENAAQQPLKTLLLIHTYPEQNLVFQSKAQKKNKSKQATKQVIPDIQKTKVSSKKPPPKNLEKIFSQSRNRRALGHDGLFKRSNPKAKTTADAHQDSSTKPQPTGKQNPVSKLKKRRLANSDVNSNAIRLFRYRIRNSLVKRLPLKNQLLKDWTPRKHQRILNNNVAAH